MPTALATCASVLPLSKLDEGTPASIRSFAASCSIDSSARVGDTASFRGGNFPPRFARDSSCRARVRDTPHLLGNVVVQRITAPRGAYPCRRSVPGPASCEPGDKATARATGGLISWWEFPTTIVWQATKQQHYSARRQSNSTRPWVVKPLRVKMASRSGFVPVYSRRRFAYTYGAAMSQMSHLAACEPERGRCYYTKRLCYSPACAVSSPSPLGAIATA
jgi:hypothetical protein